ncbi:MAG: archease [Nanoarchaeota archaeon]
MKTKYKFLPHTADIKFKAYGKTLNKAFENAALAISNILTNENKIKPKKGITSKISGSDKESLLYNFIEEIISLLDIENFVTAKAEITIKGGRIGPFTLKAIFYGDNASNYKGLNHIKAPTYAEMHVKDLGSKKGWEIQAVVDV